jgi:nickel-dependent lactate racemase
VKAIAPQGNTLSFSQITQTLQAGLEGKFTGQNVLVLIPDHTRSLPLPLLFRNLVEILNDVHQLDFMVALGTHPPLSPDEMNRLVGITAAEKSTRYQHIGLLNHAWDDPNTLVCLGRFEQDQIKALAGNFWHSSLPKLVDIRVNKLALQYDHLLILGPTFPHEVVGFSGGAKYLFPGISGPEMINASHWLGALAGVVATIGIQETPVRALIHAAAQKLSTPITLIALVVVDHNLSSLHIGDYISAWQDAASQSARRHICWCEKPFQTVLSCAAPMYDELWTAAKAMYKLEPAVAPGGEIIVYAPHLDTISRVHGKYLSKIGYHILPYFLENWENFKHIPLSALAHSTHLRGSWVMHNGIEQPNVSVTLASKISAEDCAHLNLGYIDPAKIELKKFINREEDGILFVPRAGETLFKTRQS